MEFTDLERMSKALTTLAMVLNHNLDKDRAKSFYEPLRTLPIESIERACKYAAKECERFPAPVKLLEIANRISGGGEVDDSNPLAPSWQDAEGRWWTRKRTRVERALDPHPPSIREDVLDALDAKSPKLPAEHPLMQMIERMRKRQVPF